MRIVLFYDLPTVRSSEVKQANAFRKFLIKEGFIMLQESVYWKLTLNGTMANLVKDKVKKNKPPKGLIQMLTITEKQFAKMEYVLGKNTSNVLDSDSRMVVLWK